MSEFFTEPASAKVSPGEREALHAVYAFVESKFGSAKYVLGLAVDFCLLAQQISSIDKRLAGGDPNLTKAELFQRYPRMTEDAGRPLNTLTLEFGGLRFGIRQIDNLVLSLFQSLGRTSYPSSAPYTTGQWAKYADDLLAPSFRLSTSARRRLCEDLIDLGLQRITENRFYATRIERERLFERLVKDYPRGARGENAGMVFQGIAYGFFRADSPHLSLVTDKVRTGSKRQKRFGDVDGYYGLHLELSIEVKDLAIDASNVEKELSAFCLESRNSGIKGIAFVRTCDEHASNYLQNSGVVTMTQASVLDVVQLWDWQKQDIAVHGLMHYLAHIEENPEAVKRFLTFVREIEPTHDSGPVRNLVSASGDRIALIAFFPKWRVTHGCFFTITGGATRE
ncbi:MAG TPA: hypothetical protein VGJ26_22570 [Pirellulales bacterium]